MSIRPVDYQILMPKINEVAKTQNDAQHKITGQALQQAENTVKTADRDTKSVHSQKEAQKLAITDKQKGGSGNSKKRKQSKDREDQETTGPAEAKFPRHTIDIRL